MLSVSGASMVRMIDRLVKDGLAMREPSISDRRVNRIVITDAGHRLYAVLKDEAAAVRRELLAGMELEKLAHLTELLEQMQSILGRVCHIDPAKLAPPHFPFELSVVHSHNSRRTAHVRVGLSTNDIK